jgi:invasion protein IalB
LAWAHDSAQDKDMIERMKAKSTMTVKGTSVKNTYSIDSYSLSGFTSAFKRMKELCQ